MAKTSEGLLDHTRSLTRVAPLQVIDTSTKIYDMLHVVICHICVLWGIWSEKYFISSFIGSAELQAKRAREVFTSEFSVVASITIKWRVEVVDYCLKNFYLGWMERASGFHSFVGLQKKHAWLKKAIFEFFVFYFFFRFLCFLSFFSILKRSGRK